MAAGDTQLVMLPRQTSARSEAAQFWTWYCVLYVGWTLDFIHSVWSAPSQPHSGFVHQPPISGLNHAAYGLPVNASRPGSPQAHASLGSGWRPTLAGWDWIPTGFRTRFRRSHHVILSPLTGLSRHTRCCMNTHCGWGGVARTSRDPPQEPHYGDEVEGSSQEQNEVSRGELGGLQPDSRSTRRCDGVVVLVSDRCLDAPPERPAGRPGSGGTRISPSRPR